MCVPALLHPEASGRVGARGRRSVRARARGRGVEVGAPEVSRLAHVKCRRAGGAGGSDGRCVGAGGERGNGTIPCPIEPCLPVAGMRAR